jgi:hypothetical protein
VSAFEKVEKAHAKEYEKVLKVRALANVYSYIADCSRPFKIL